MRITASILASLLATSLTAQTQAMDITVGGDIWTTEISGGIEAPDFLGGYNLGLENFDTDKENSLNIYAIFEQNKANGYPNFKLSYAQLEHSGPGLLTIGALEFDISKGTIDPAYADVSAYFNVVDHPMASLDIGLTGRIIRGDLSLIVSAGQAPLKSSLSTELALIYGKLALKPLPGLALVAEANYGELSDEKSSDVLLYAQYTYQSVGLRAGFRTMDTEINSDVNGIDVTSELKYEGGFVGLNYQF